MTDNTAGDKTPQTNVPPSGVPAAATAKIRVSSVAGLLAVIPHLLGFHPSRSMVLVGLDGPRGRIGLGFRYDLPDPPDPARSREIAEHTVAVLERRNITTVIAVGYGPGTLVTPVAETVKAALGRAPITLRDLLRVEDGRYWSYVCQDPGCCPPEGVPFDGPSHPNAAAMASAGMTVRPDREALAASLAPVTGAEAESMRQAEQRVLRRAQRLAAGMSGSRNTRLLTDAGKIAIQDAIAQYRSGGTITDEDQMAWIMMAISDIRVRDDAWARMDPEHRAAHLRLWTDLVRHAPDHYMPAPASLLAFTAWQSGEGALANIAIERALSADPGYSMAQLIGEALDAGLPPSAARLSMTPEEVEAAYADSEPGGRAARAKPSGGAARRGSAGRPSAKRGPADRGTPRPGSAGRGSAVRNSAARPGRR
jgi:hypothetical protein